MEAVILAGGFGTRLSKIIGDVPKPMAPVSGNPFLFYLFNWLREYPVEKVILSVGYKSEFIVSFFGNSFFDIPIIYAVEEKPLGTGGALKYALGKTKGDNIMVLNGDTYFPVDINRVYSFHTNGNYKFSVALKRMENFSRYGSVDCQGSTIVGFNEKKPCDEGLINGGIYLINRQFIESMQLPEMFSLEKDLLEKEVILSTIKGIVFDDIFIDIGVPEDYERAATILHRE